MGRYSADRPPPGHVLSVFPVVTREGATTTALLCSCGWRPGRVSDQAPESGGTTIALGLYRDHLEREMGP